MGTLAENTSGIAGVVNCDWRQLVTRPATSAGWAPVRRLSRNRNVATRARTGRAPMRSERPAGMQFPLAGGCGRGVAPEKWDIRGRSGYQSAHGRLLPG